jgi:hypothetical protein
MAHSIDHAGRRRFAQAIHLERTEAETLDEALEIIKGQRRRAKMVASAIKAHRRRPQSLHEQVVRYNNSVAFATCRKKQATQGARRPHPFADLADAEKRGKMREMYESGLWGTGLTAGRRLAQAFKDYSRCLPRAAKYDAEPIGTSCILGSRVGRPDELRDRRTSNESHKFAPLHCLSPKAQATYGSLSKVCRLRYWPMSERGQIRP